MVTHTVSETCLYELGDTGSTLCCTIPQGVNTIGHLRDAVQWHLVTTITRMLIVSGLYLLVLGC